MIKSKYSDVKTAMLNEDPVQYNGKLYRVTAVIQRTDHRFEPPRLRTFVELEDALASFLLIEPSGPRTGFPREVPAEDISIYK